MCHRTQSCQIQDLCLCILGEELTQRMLTIRYTITYISFHFLCNFFQEKDSLEIEYLYLFFYDAQIISIWHLVDIKTNWTEQLGHYSESFLSKQSTTHIILLLESFCEDEDRRHIPSYHSTRVSKQKLWSSLTAYHLQEQDMETSVKLCWHGMETDSK